MVEKDAIEKALTEVIDPELQLDVMSLGLIYEINIEDKKVSVIMSLTSPVCPYGPELMESVRQAASGVEGVAEVDLELTFTPAWGPDRMSEEARMTLGI